MSKHHEFSSSSRVFAQAMICANHGLEDKQCRCNLYTGHSARLDKQCHCDLYTAYNCCFSPSGHGPQELASEWTCKANGQSGRKFSFGDAVSVHSFLTRLSGAVMLTFR